LQDFAKSKKCGVYQDRRAATEPKKAPKAAVDGVVGLVVADALDSSNGDTMSVVEGKHATLCHH
jgi:hypothetical protein